MRRFHSSRICSTARFIPTVTAAIVIKKYFALIDYLLRMQALKYVVYHRPQNLMSGFMVEPAVLMKFGQGMQAIKNNDIIRDVPAVETTDHRNSPFPFGTNPVRHRHSLAS